MIMYLSCSNNNRVNTVLSYFSKAVQKHGLPTHVRSDLGGENIDVWRFMVEEHYRAPQHIMREWNTFGMMFTDV